LIPAASIRALDASLQWEQIDVLSPKAKIIYSGFWDVPSAFVVSRGGNQYLFHRGHFDDESDDYPDTYKVYTLPNLPEDVVRDSWARIESLTTGFLGEIPIREIEFDPMRRCWIDTKVIGVRFGVK
jgi:hypothetical protein